MSGFSLNFCSLSDQRRTGTGTDLLRGIAYGKKVHSVDALPDFHKRVPAEKYPERL